MDISNIIRATLNITAYAGDTFDTTMWFKDAQGVKIDLTGCTILMQIRDAEDALIKELSAPVDFTIDDSVIVFKSNLNIPAGTYQYDLQCTFQDGRIKTLAGGKFKVQKQVTIPQGS